MEFIRHLPTEALIGLVVLMFLASGWLLKLTYNLFKDRFKLWDEDRKQEFKDIKDSFVTVDKHFVKLDKNIDLLFIEIKSSDKASDVLLSNGKSFLDIKEKEKQRLIRDYELQNT